jgi:hypothetical protein
MKLIVLSLTAAAAVTVPSSEHTGVVLNGFTPGGLELTAVNQDHPTFRQTGARASVRVVATTRPFSVGAR